MMSHTRHRLTTFLKIPGVSQMIVGDLYDQIPFTIYLCDVMLFVIPIRKYSTGDKLGDLRNHVMGQSQ